MKIEKENEQLKAFRERDIKLLTCDIDNLKALNAELLKENQELKKLNEKLVAQLSEVMSLAGHHVGQRTQFEIEETLRNEIGPKQRNCDSASF